MNTAPSNLSPKPESPIKIQRPEDETVDPPQQPQQKDSSVKKENQFGKFELVLFECNNPKSKIFSGEQKKNLMLSLGGALTGIFGATILNALVLLKPIHKSRNYYIYGTPIMLLTSIGSMAFTHFYSKSLYAAHSEQTWKKISDRKRIFDELSFEQKNLFMDGVIDLEQVIPVDEQKQQPTPTIPSTSEKTDQLK